MTGFKSNQIFLHDIYIYIIYSHKLLEDIKNIIGQDNWNTQRCMIDSWEGYLKTLEGN